MLLLVYKWGLVQGVVEQCEMVPDVLQNRLGCVVPVASFVHRVSMFIYLYVRIAKTCSDLIGAT